MFWMYAYNQTTYTFSDHLGSRTLTVDASGSVVANARYLPYGEERWNEVNMPTDRGFTGQRNEAAFGLMDYNARYYSPVLGRFISPDTVIPDPKDAKSFDRYAYVNNDSVNATDPTGHRPTDGCNYESCSGDSDSVIVNPPNPYMDRAPASPNTNKVIPLFDHTDFDGYCVWIYCTGGEDTYWAWWRNQHLPNLPFYLEQTIYQGSDVAGRIVSPFFDVRQGWTGLKPPRSVGFGIDGFIQVGKDLKRNDLNWLQRTSRGGIVAVESSLTSSVSTSLADAAALASVVPATGLAVATEQLWVAPVGIVGAWVGAYVGVNILVSTGWDALNSYGFPKILLGEY